MDNENVQTPQMQQFQAPQAQQAPQMQPVQQPAQQTQQASPAQPVTAPPVVQQAPVETQTPPVQVAQREKKKPRLFFKQDERILVTINGYHSNETGEVSFVVADENDTNTSDGLINDMFTKVPYKFWFTRCTYDRLNRFRTRSMIYNTEDQNNTINEIKLREFFLMFNLVDWNITDDDGNKIPLTFDTNNALSDESIKLAYSLPSNLMDAALISYERKIGLI